MILKGMPEAKALFKIFTKANSRKRGEQTGLETLVVHALNSEYLV